MRNSYKSTKILLNKILTGDYNPQAPLDDLLPFADSCQFCRVKSQDTFINQSDPAEYIYFILKGRFAVLSNIDWAANAIITYVSQPHILGLIEYLLDIEFYTAYVVATEDCLLFRIRVQELTNILQEDAKLCYLMLKASGHMLEDNMNTAETHRIFPARDILGQYLYNSAREYYLPNTFRTESPDIYRYPHTRKVLSEELNINLRTLYRYLDILSEKGYLHLSRGKICIGPEEFEKLKSRYGTIVM